MVEMCCGNSAFRLRADLQNVAHTSKNQYRKFEKKYSQKRNCAAKVPIRIHVSVSDLNIPMIDLPVLLQEICGPILGICKSLKYT
jgi:hypothetical protein